MPCTLPPDRAPHAVCLPLPAAQTQAACVALQLPHLAVWPCRTIAKKNQAPLHTSWQHERYLPAWKTAVEWPCRPPSWPARAAARCAHTLRLSLSTRQCACRRSGGCNVVLQQRGRKQCPRRLHNACGSAQAQGSGPAPHNGGRRWGYKGCACHPCCAAQACQQRCYRSLTVLASALQRAHRHSPLSCHREEWPALVLCAAAGWNATCSHAMHASRQQQRSRLSSSSAANQQHRTKHRGTAKESPHTQCTAIESTKPRRRN